MIQLNNEVLYERLLQKDKLCALARYIYEVNGTELRRLDYQSAAEALGISKNTVGANVLKLVILDVLEIDDGKIRLKQELFNKEAN